MREIVADDTLVARCGIYCGACKRYLKGSCPGCRENKKATWCTVRTCTAQNGYVTCGECSPATIDGCKEFNSFMAKVFGFIFRSDRRACVERIREIGTAAFAEEMADAKRVSIRRG